LIIFPIQNICSVNEGRGETLINRKKTHAVMNNKEQMKGTSINTESITEFIKLAEKEEWSEEDLNRFTATEGVQYIIKQEKKDDPSYNENAVKNSLKKVKQGHSEDPRWEKAWKWRKKIQRQLEYIFNRWEYLVERPLSVAKTYLPEDVEGKGTFYLLPGGAHESYSDEHGFAINLGHNVWRDTHVMFLIPWEGYRHVLTCIAGKEPSISQCQTPSEFVKAFLSITHRQGMAAFVASKAAGTQEKFFQDNLADIEEKRALYGEAFQLALEGNIHSELTRIQKGVFTGYTSPAAVIGAAMAQAIDTGGDRRGMTRGREMLLVSSGKMGFIPFFELYKPYKKTLVLPDTVWEAFEMVRTEKKVNSKHGAYSLV
jgi:hypothetical protein